MELTCPACQKTMKVPGFAAGERINCPACGENVRISEQEVVESGEVFIDEDALISVASRSTKTCPMCGATVAVEARRCQGCGELLAGFQGADGYSIQGVWREGNRLVMIKDAVLPNLCVQTNQPTQERLRRRLYWHSPWVYLLVLVSLLVYVIVALIVRQKADIQIGLSRERLVRRRWVIFFAWVGFLGGIVVTIVGLGNTNAGGFGWLVVLSGFILLLGSAITGMLLSRIVAPTRITARYVWLKGVHPLYLAALPPFPGEA